MPFYAFLQKKSRFTILSKNKIFLILTTSEMYTIFFYLITVYNYILNTVI